MRWRWRVLGATGVAASLIGGVLAVPAAEAGPAAEPAAACTPNPATPKRQFRASWVASVVNIDWPSRPGLSAAAQQAELNGWLDDAVRQHHNAVVLQVRPTADAFWPSHVEPWSKYLTGTQGGDPGYDPLAYAVSEAHRHNLELHAWFNPYRVSMDTNAGALLPTHPARQHPDWIVTYGGKLYYNPGVPEARKLVEDAIMDAVSRYDIDAVHFDDYFYPYPVAGQVFDDAAQYAQYGGGLSLADWRRQNINLLITELQHRIKAAKPWVKFGISPFAVWRNAATDPLGSATTAGVQTYDDLYADTRRWVREGWIDYIVPQVYWAQGFAPADYDIVVPWWADQVRGTPVHLYVGQATYKVGTSTQSPDWSDPAELSDHLARNTQIPEVKGDVYFSAKDVRADRLGATSLLNATWYTRPALVPPTMLRLDSRSPLPVLALRSSRTADGVRVAWGQSPLGATSYAVYRRDLAGDDRCPDNDARNLLATTRSTTFADPTAEPGHEYIYTVTALDRLWNESQPIPTVVTH